MNAIMELCARLFDKYALTKIRDSFIARGPMRGDRFGDPAGNGGAYTNAVATSVQDLTPGERVRITITEDGHYVFSEGATAADQARDPLLLSGTYIRDVPDGCKNLSVIAVTGGAAGIMTVERVKSMRGR